MKYSKDLKTAGSIRERLKDVKTTEVVKRIFIPQHVKTIDTRVGRKSKYGLRDRYGNPIEILYDLSTEPLFPGSDLLAASFVSDQFSSMKRSFEELSNKGSAYGTLNPERALIRADELYDSHIDMILESFVGALYEFKNDEIYTFKDFCNHFLNFISNSRNGVKIEGGLPISKSLFFASGNVPINSSGLVIDFKTSDYDDSNSIVANWLRDTNFKLFCDAANKVGFFVDMHHPFRLIANLAHEKMQRAAEFRGSSVFFPGDVSNVLETFYLRVDLYDFMILKDHLLQAYSEFSESNPEIYRKKPCNGKVKIVTVPRERLKLEHLIVPPIPGRPRASLESVFGEVVDPSTVNDLTAYGLHDEKYGLDYFTRLYIEVRYREIDGIKNYLSKSEKRGIVKKAIDLTYRGNIDAAFKLIGRKFNSFRYLVH